MSCIHYQQKIRSTVYVTCKKTLGPLCIAYPAHASLRTWHLHTVIHCAGEHDPYQTRYVWKTHTICQCGARSMRKFCTYIHICIFHYRKYVHTYTQTSEIIVYPIDGNACWLCVALRISTPTHTHKHKHIHIEQIWSVCLRVSLLHHFLHAWLL